MLPKLIMTIPNFTTRYIEPTEVQVWETEYKSAPILALAITKNGDKFPPEILCKATTNMKRYGYIPDEGNVHIKDYAENEGVRQALEDAGVIGPVVRKIAAGFGSVTEHRLLKRGESVMGVPSSHHDTDA